MSPPDRRSLLGLLVWRELVRLARRGQAAQARALLLYFQALGLLLGAAWWTAAHGPPPLLRSTPSIAAGGGRDSDADFVAFLGLALLEAQLLFAAILAPAYAVGAIAEEKERVTLALLLTTELSDREIVWGKAAARLVLVMASVAAGLPILVLAEVYGGASLELVLVGTALAMGTTVLATGIGIDSAASSPDSQTAYVRAYCYAAALIGGLLVLAPFSPFAVLAYEAGARLPARLLPLDGAATRRLLGFGYALLQTAIGLAFVARAAGRLRSIDPGAGPHSPTRFPEPPRGRAAPVLIEALPAKRPAPPPVDDANPVLWKERHLGRSGIPAFLDAPLQWLTVAVAAVAIGLFAVGAWELLSRAVMGLDPDSAHEFTHPGLGLDSAEGVGWLLASGELAAALFLLQAGGGITACVAGERERATLDSLLATTLPRRTILWAKTRVCLEKRLASGVAAATAVGCAFGVKGGLEFGFAALAGMAAAFWFTIACGAWLSVRCRSSGQAFRLCLLPATAVLASPLIVWAYADWSQPLAAMRAVLWAAAAVAVLGCLTWQRAVARLARNR